MLSDKNTSMMKLMKILMNLIKIMMIASFIIPSCCLLQRYILA